MTRLSDPKTTHNNSLRAKVEDALTRYGAMRPQEITALLGEEMERVQQALTHLLSLSRVEYEGKPGQRIYSIRVRKSSFTKTRKLTSAEPFLGVDWSNSIQRPGCQDAFKYPSRRGDMLTPYRPPVLNASSLRIQANPNDVDGRIVQWR